jgi:thiamine pyrophosphate-dependent acetolactate synthase large subunit-like protein
MDFQLADGSPAVFSKAKAPSDSEGKIHLNRALHELQARMKPDTVVVADDGDFLSVARVGLFGGSYLDPGSLGCIGVGTRLQFADHAAMARAFGMHARRVERVEDLGAAIDEAMQNLPALLDVIVSPEAKSSYGKSALAWKLELQPLSTWEVAEQQWRNSEAVK